MIGLCWSSKAATAAPSWAIVVNSGLSAATVAVRISKPSARALRPLGVLILELHRAEITQG